MPGEAYAIACAFLWALSSTLIKSQTHKINVVVLGALRTVPAVLIYWGILLFSGRVGELLTLSPRALLYLAGSTVMGLVVGDTIYFWSMKLIGLSRAMPLSTTYPFFTMLLSLLFLDEQIGWPIVAGATLITGGAYLLAVTPRGRRLHGRTSTSNPPLARDSAQSVNPLGVALALSAAFCWATSTILLRVGLEGVDITLANTTRLSVLLVVLSVIMVVQGEAGKIGNYGQAYGLRSLGIVFLAGIVGTGLGTFAFLAAVQRAGAAKASILTAATPLFGVPLSFLLKERPTRRTLLGTVLTVVGVWLTI